MKISQKLTLAFIGTSLLFGALGSVHLKRNSEIQYWTNERVNSLSQEAQSATDLSRSLQAINSYSTEILNLKKTPNLQNNEVREKLVIKLDNLVKDIQQASDRMQDIETGNAPDKTDNLKLVKNLEIAFHDYQKNIDIFLKKIDEERIEEGRIFFETKLSPQVKEKLIPLIKRYQELALKESQKEIEEKLNRSHQDIFTSTLLASIFFAAIYLYIYRSTCLPLKELNDAALKIGQGKLDTKIFSDNREDEFGIVAKTFNKVTEGLQQSTVSNYYLDNILNSMADSLIVINTNTRIFKVNQVTLNLLGYAEKELIGKPINLIITDDFGLNINYLIKSDKFPLSCELTYLTKDNRRIPIEFYINKIVNEAGGTEAVICLGHNITERKKAEKALKQRERRYALAANTINEGLWDWHIQTNEVYFSARWKKMLGYSESEIENKIDRWFDLIHPQSRETFKYKIANHIKNNNSQFEITYQMRHKDGNYRWILCRAIAVKDDRGKKVEYLIGAITDITESKLREEKLRYEALYDPLTKLPNRTFFTQKLKQLIESAREQNDRLFAVMYLDLDCSEAINDSVGYLGGDTLLLAIVKRLKNYLPDGTIVRLRGDKLAIILEQIKLAKDASKIAEKILENLKKPFKIKNRQILIQPLIAIALSTKYYNKTEDLLQDLDNTLYCLKASGKKTGYSIYQASMQVNLLVRRELEKDLPKAIEQNQFKIFYQPIVKLSGEKIIGFEALMRWQHPQKGLISAADFVSVARETGELISISWSIVREACAQMVSWQKQYSVEKDMFVSVNISAQQFFQTDFVAQIHKIIQETNLKPACLQLEITEKVIREDKEAAKSVLEQLKSLNIKIAVDNFSNEDSSLSYVFDLPINRVKINRSFFRNINIDRKRFKLMRSVVNLSLDLGIEPIATEIETQEELTKLQELKCKYVQGYFFSRPLNQKSATALIAEKYDRVKSIL